MGSSHHRGRRGRSSWTNLLCQGHFPKTLSVLEDKEGDRSGVICEHILDVMHHGKQRCFNKPRYSSLFITLKTSELSARSSSK